MGETRRSVRFGVLACVAGVCLIVVWGFRGRLLKSPDPQARGGGYAEAEGKMVQPVVTAIPPRRMIALEGRVHEALLEIGERLERGEGPTMKQLRFFADESERYFPFLERVVLKRGDAERSAALAVLTAPKRIFALLPEHDPPERRRHAINYRFAPSTEVVLGDLDRAPLYRDFARETF